MRDLFRVKRLSPAAKLIRIFIFCYVLLIDDTSYMCRTRVATALTNADEIVGQLRIYFIIISAGGNVELYAVTFVKEMKLIISVKKNEGTSEEYVRWLRSKRVFKKKGS